jgi:hypothetical protein
MNQLSKDQIKDRMLKRAANHWGYSDVELENVFDPIVNLLFDVCAKELEKISNEVYSSRRRITERFIEILTPTVSVKAMPARGILAAYPVENELTLSNYHQFYFQRKENNPYNPNENAIKNYYFGPTKPIKLNRNKINYVVLPSGIQSVVGEQFKEELSSDKYLKPTPYSTIWIGLEHQGSGIIKDLMFYFYLKNIHNRNTFLHFLPRAKWYLNDLQLTTEKGYNSEEVFKATNTDELIQKDIYHIDKIQEHVSDFYRDNFITIKDIITIDDGKYSIPDEFKDFIPEENLEEIAQEKLLWLRVEFPNAVGSDILSEIFCANNCFPIINKKLYEIQGNVKDVLNIYPLELGDEYFLELLSVSNDRINNLDIITSGLEAKDEEYVYLRYGGISRFDERNAAEEINYMIDLIRDEASAFSRLGGDFTESNLKEINQIISRFKNKISEVRLHDASNPYLILNTKKKKEKGTVFVSYWTTDGMSANKINAFSKFVVSKGSDFDKTGITLLSSTQGGKNELTNSEKVYAYRENLISNQRVVTRQDIIILCKNHYGDAVEKIEVKNGIQTSLDSNIGYIPTIDIYLKRKETNIYNEDEWDYLKQDLKLMIENRAINVVPFRILYN